jgi:hypothetical protein
MATTKAMINNGLILALPLVGFGPFLGCASVPLTFLVLRGSGGAWVGGCWGWKAFGLSKLARKSAPVFR